MELITLLKENSTFFLTVVGLFSLLVGSFLNAAIYRIPIMLQKGWREECQELFGGEDTEINSESSKTFNLKVSPISFIASTFKSGNFFPTIAILYLFFNL